MVAATLSGTVAIIGAVNSISISSIVFKQGDTTVHAISANLLSINSNNTWTLDNHDTWTSKLTQSDYTVTVYLSGDGGNGGNVRDSNFITTAIDTVKPVCYIYKTTLSAMQMWPCKGGLSWERQFCTISTISQHLKSHTGLVRDMSFGKSVSGLIRDMLFGGLIYIAHIYIYSQTCIKRSS
jgi:hypothetical protein